jgi:hypothetical protein
MVAPVPNNALADAGPAGPAHTLRRTASLTAGMGLAHALLFLLAYGLIFSVAGSRAPGALASEVYQRRLNLFGLYVMPFAGIAFLWFIVALRMWISAHGRPENVLYSNIQLVTGILYVGMIFVASAASATAAASIEPTSVPSDQSFASQFPRFGSTILFVFSLRMASMFVLSTSNIGKGSGVLPRWFVLAGYAVGLVLLLSASFSTVLALVFPVWLLVLCALLLRRARQLPPGGRPAALSGHGGPKP